MLGVALRKYYSVFSLSHCNALIHFPPCHQVGLVPVCCFHGGKQASSTAVNLSTNNFDFHIHTKSALTLITGIETA